MRIFSRVMLTVLGLALLTISSGCDSESRQNKKVIMKTIEAHGDSYRIIRERFGSIGDSGRNEDFMTVEQNDIIYTVYADGGKVSLDTYVGMKQGKTRANNVVSECSKLFEDKSYRVYGETLDANSWYPDYFEMKLIVFNADLGNTDWLYDVYTYMYDNEMPCALHMILYEESEDAVENEIENGYGKADINFRAESIPSSERLTAEQFADKLKGK